MLFNQLSASARKEEAAILQGRQELLAKWEGDPWEWFTGKDLDGRPILWTRDEKDEKAPLKPFPTDKPYLKRLVYGALGEEPVFVDKVRQVMASTTLILLADWYNKFRLARNVLVSKQKEAEAEKLIREKLRSSHSMLPQWVQEALPITMTPANRVDYKNTKSVLHGVAQNFAAAEARGTTASIVFIDEAAYQDFTGDILDAVAAMATRVWVVTTPLRFSKGGRVFYSFLEKEEDSEGRSINPPPNYDTVGDEWDPKVPIPGYNERVTGRGVRVIEIDSWADPAKRDPLWLVEQEQKYTSKSKFEREMKRNWNVGEGDIFFPEFLENGGRDKFVMPIPTLLPGPVYRGWDFGRRAPACTWFQYDRKNRRVLVLRSIAPKFIGVHSFRDVVLYLSGQLPMSQLDGAGRSFIAELEANPGTPTTPWFRAPLDKPLSFIDFGGWEAVQESDMVKEEGQARTRAEVLQEAGIYLAQVAAATHRDTLMRRLLALRPDGYPGIIFDPSNGLLVNAIAGGLTFKKPTMEDPMPNTYMKTGEYDNIYEALTYGLVGVVPLNERPLELFSTSFPDRRRVVELRDPERLFHEGRRSSPTKDGW